MCVCVCVGVCVSGVCVKVFVCLRVCIYGSDCV